MVMKFLNIVIGLLASQLLASSPAFAISDAHKTADVTVQFEKFKGGDETFIFAVIKPRGLNQTVSSSNQQTARRLLNVANDWFFDQLIARYVHVPADELRAKLDPMRAEGIHLTTGSSFILVFKGSEPEKPLGTLWTYYPDRDGKVDFQKDLESDLWKYPVPEPKMANYPFLTTRHGDFVSSASPLMLQGGVVEMKRFALDPGAARPLMLAMLLRGEAHDRLNTQAIHTPGHGFMLPAEYVLRCNHALIPIYTRFGFKLVPGLAANEANEDYIMKIDRADYVKHAAKRLAQSRENGWQMRFESADENRSREVELRVNRTLDANMCRNLF